MSGGAGTGALRRHLQTLPPPLRPAALLAALRRRAAHLLGLGDGAALADDVPWTELGFDSLRAVDLAVWLANELDLPQRSTLLFDQPTARRLTHWLLAQLDALAATPAGALPPPTAGSRAHHDVAIVGAACRFPGGEDLAGYWRLLRDGGDAVRPLPPQRFDLDALYDPDAGAAGRIYVRDAALLDGIDRFDAAAFGISPREAQQLDPAQRLLLEVAWHTLEHANLPPPLLAGRRVGVYVGTRASEYFDSAPWRGPAAANAWQQSGNAASTAAGRLAYTFGFDGPCYAIDTACSGSLVAVHVAVRALRAGECDAALAGGTGSLHDPVVMASLCRARMLAPDGRCKPFAAAADGYGRGEGCGLVLLKRLADAERDGDRVLAVIRGTALDQDGRSSGLTVPNGPAQTRLLQQALADAGLGPDDIDFVEAHGTGTSLGDPIEAQALDAAFAARSRPLPIGAGKSNLGHLEAAAGIAGLLKVVLALRARLLPATLHALPANPHVDWTRSKVRVVTTNEPLPANGTLHAGVSSFGFSGTNCHVVLATPPAAAAAAAAPPPNTRHRHLLALQAVDGPALKALALAHAEALAAGPVDLAAWCHTAATRRSPLPQRAAFVAEDVGELVASLRRFAATGATAAPTNGDALRAAAAVFTRGGVVDLGACCPLPPGSALVELPVYPFQRRRFWLSPPGHPLLGEGRDSSLLAKGQRLFAGSLRPPTTPWLADHRADGRPLLPFAGAIEYAFAAAVADGATLPLTAHDVGMPRPLPLDRGTTPCELLLTRDGERRHFELRARGDDGVWQHHASGWLAAATPDASPPPARTGDEIPAAQLYQLGARRRLEHGPACRGVLRAWRREGEAFAMVALPDDLDAEPYVLHPVLLDACLQTLVAALPPGDTPLLPLGADSVTVHHRGATAGSCHVRTRTAGDRTLADLTLWDPAGRVIASVRGLWLLPPADELLHHLAYEPATAPAPTPPPARVLVVGWPALNTALAPLLPPGSSRSTTPAGLAAALAESPVDLLLLTLEPATEDLATAAELACTTALSVAQVALQAAPPPRLGLVTVGAFAAEPAPFAPSPAAAAAAGLWRTLASEHPALRPFVLDLDPHVPGGDVETQARQLAAELRTPLADAELALRLGRRLVPRVRRGPDPDVLQLPAAPFHLRAIEYGLDRLQALPFVPRQPAAGEVLVRVDVAALNYKDVLFARGTLRRFAARDGVRCAAEQPLGYEAGGEVVALGAGVTRPALGDRVVLVGNDCLATHATVRADATFVVPPGVDAVAATGAPAVFATVLHALFDLAEVRAGEVVLVHAAAGGVGQAAIQVLQRAGCRVLATASEAKQPFVRGLGAELVGDTRRGGFAAAVLAATGGRGADVVLHTLGAERVAESLQALAVGGRFVELGKVGVWSPQQLRAARPDVVSLGFDLAERMADDPTLLPRLLARLAAGLADGSLRPPGATVLPFAQAPRALRQLAKGHHVGKLLLHLPHDTNTLPADRTIVLTGSSGGTAPAIVRALVDRGARRFLLLSRRPPAAATLAMITAAGGRALVAAVDVGDGPALATALQRARDELGPLAGVVHAAGVLQDGMVASLTAADLRRALWPKLIGALHLHAATRGDDLRFFVALSSVAGWFGSQGQAAYAAANAALDAFAAARTAAGLPATAIAFGPWRDVGMAARLDERHRQRLQRRGFGLLAAAEAAARLVRHRNTAAAIAVVHFEPEPGQAPRPTPNSAPGLTTANPIAPPTAAAAPAAPLRERVRAAVARALGFADATQLDASTSFRDLGLDSLLAVDAKDHLEDLIGRPLPATLLFEHQDLDRLVAWLERLLATPG